MPTSQNHSSPDIEELMQSLDQEFAEAFGSLPAQLTQESQSGAQLLAELETEMADLQPLLAEIKPAQLTSNTHQATISALISNLEAALGMVSTLKKTSPSQELGKSARLHQLVDQIKVLLSQVLPIEEV